ncbi:MAG: NAD(P)-dependent alcohol dehydrogenase [Flavobacteriales bacterium]
MMNAVTQYKYGGPEVLNIEQVPMPLPKDTEVLIQVHATPITTAGSFMREGVPYLGRLAIGLFKPKANIPGVGFSGEIKSVGKKVTQFKVGDKVFGETLFNQGTQAQYVCADQNEVIAKKPNGLTHAEASPIIDGPLTSMNFLKLVADVKPNDRILVIGASGSLGTAAVQIASAMGATVTGVCSTRNIELVQSLGAKHVIDYTCYDLNDIGKKFDVIYDTLGVSSYSVCKPLLEEEGTYMSPILNFKLLCQALWTAKFSKKKAKFSATGILAKDELKKLLKQVMTFIEEDKLRMVMDRKYTIDQITEAHAYVDKGHKKGNVVVCISH